MKNRNFIRRLMNKIEIRKCPQCGNMTLQVFDRGDNCTSCRYYVYYP